MRKKRTVTNASKLEELKAEYAANNEKIIQYQTKIVELQERNKTLATDITSRENTEIVGLVRGINMTPDQLAQLGNWAAVAACLFRPSVADPSEDADPRVPFSRVGTTNRLPLFKQLDQATILAVQVNYLALRSRLTSRYRHLFSSHPAAKGQPSSSWPQISQSLLGEEVWNEQQLFRTSATQVLFRLDNIIVQSQQNKSRHA